MSDGPSFSEGISPHQITYGPDTVKIETAHVISDLAAKAYAEESDRNKGADAKTGTFIAASGAAIFFLLSTVAKPPAFTQSWLSVVYAFGLLLALALLVASEVSFLHTIRTQQFDRFKIEDWTTYEYLSTPPAELLSRLASTHSQLVANNTEKTDRKLDLQAVGVRLFLAGLIVLACVVVISAFAMVGGK